MICLPLPRSSAGVPRKTISPGSSSASAASAIAAPTPEAAIVLWPQPCPSPGSASYSARIPIRGPSPPRPPRRTARIAVARLPGRVLDARSRAAPGPRRPRPPPVLLEGGLRVRRGSGATGRGSRRGRPRRRSPSRAFVVGERRRPDGARWQSGTRSPGCGGIGCPQPSVRVAPPDARQRSADRVASATTTSAIMNSAIGSSSRPWRRSTTRTATTIPTQADAADRRAASRPGRRSGGDARRRSARRAGSGSGDGQPDEHRADEPRARVHAPDRGS